MKGFEKLGIPDEILKALKDMNYKEPTEIQEKAIPVVLEGKDLIAGSETGSGKTLVFGSGIVAKSRKSGRIQSLVLTPTRELAAQIAETLEKTARYKPLEIAVIYGGVSIEPQIRKLARADAVVGTPGRILDHLQRKTIDFRSINILVLDEVDRMLDMGFIDDVEKIISQCPRNRQTLLFSATIAQEVVRIARKYMNTPVRISTRAHVDPGKLRQVYYDVKDGLKFSLLVHLLKNEKSKQVMVFCNSRINADFVAENLKTAGIDAIAIHGGLTQERRNSIMKQFHSKKVYVLVCTDVAARGLDIREVSHVYNYDIPPEGKQYVHRIGRTARAGDEGIAISILARRDHENFARVLRETRMNVTKARTPYIERVEIKYAGHRRTGSHRRPAQGRARTGSRQWRRR